MHVLEAHGVIFQYHGDFSGPVTILSTTGEAPFSVEVPFAALVSLVAEWARTVKMRELEDATDRQVLGLDGQ